MITNANEMPLKMTDCGELSNSCDRFVIQQIPPSLHTPELRCFFSAAIESNTFTAFHYKHRPESKLDYFQSYNAASSTGDTSDWMTQLHKFHKGRQCGKPKTHDESAPEFNCCVVEVRNNLSERFLKTYNDKKWSNKDGNPLLTKCIIKKIFTPCAASGSENLDKEDGVLIERRILQNLPELHPPPLMPQGNVGTPTSTFLQLIQTCRLPPRFIRKLGLRFPKYKGKRKYSSVQFDYGTRNEMSADEEEDKQKEDDSEEDDDTCEEWERHESLHEDVTSQERTKERLFEEELEVVWEKGGSGLVFYTDAQFWDQMKGDFDEQTADDWDVDMSGYYQNEMGDKDHRDYLDMRKIEQLQSGTLQESVFKKPNASSSQRRPFMNKNPKKKFGQMNSETRNECNWEKHGRGIGRKVMEKFGWKDGAGLGSSVKGPADAIEPEGQNSRSKSGFGYHGEKQPNWMNPKDPSRRVLDPDHHIISTVFDHPQKTDPPEPLLRSNPTTVLSHREQRAQQFVRQKDPD